MTQPRRRVVILMATWLLMPVAAFAQSFRKLPANHCFWNEDPPGRTTGGNLPHSHRMRERIVAFARAGKRAARSSLSPPIGAIFS